LSQTKKDTSSQLSGSNQNSNILLEAGIYVLDFFNQFSKAGLVYHNYQHTVNIVSLVEKIGTSTEAGNELSKEIIEIAQLAAWFYNIGFLKSYDHPKEQSIEYLQSFLENNQFPTNRIERVVNCINVTKSGGSPTTDEQQLFSDALNAYQTCDNFFEQSPLLRLEWELVQNRYLSNFDWNQIQLQYLLQARFFTSYAKIHFEPQVAQNILIQKSKVEKIKLTGPASVEEDGTLRKFQGLERKLPASAIQTFFRTNYRNHINLSAIADNKANIMISVNAILISVLISLLTYKNITETTPMVLMPVIIFLVINMISLVFAVLSIRPKVTSLNNEDTKKEITKRNIVFFGNFVNLDLEKYEEAVDAMFRDGELLYGNMVRDLYYLGKVLDKKYRYLTIAYNTFMVGFVTTVITFLLAILL
jgi:hypothetical protein